MDWARVKTILIVVFLLVNIFLIIAIIDKNRVNMLSLDEIQGVKQLLSRNNIELLVEVPDKKSVVPRMRVENKAADSDSIANIFIRDSKWIKSTEADGSITYTSKLHQLKVYKNSEVELLMDIAPEQLAKLTDEISARGYIQNLMASYEFLKDFEIESANTVNTGYNFKLANGKETHKLFNNNVYIDINTALKKVSLMTAMITPEGFTGKEKEISIIDALVELIKQSENNGPMKIQRISLGYFADIDRNDEIIKYSEADPAWEIETDKGVYIFNAYNGSLLKK